jgi:hypothetical protein
MKHTPAVLLLCLLVVGRPEHTIRPLARPAVPPAAAEAPVIVGGYLYENAGVRMLFKPASIAQGCVDVDPAAFIEEYIPVGARVEQLFRFPAPVGSGDLVVRIPVESNVTARVIATPHPGWGETEESRRGLKFSDGTGRQIYYHTAIAIDAAGRRADLTPRWNGREIELEVPSAFMACAVFPLTIDPWIEGAGSASGGGVSNNATGPSGADMAMAIDPMGFPVAAWADGAPGALNVFLKKWNGAAWVELGSSASGTGISGTSVANGTIDVAVDPAGNPAVLWGQGAGVFFRRWNGSGWIELAGSGTTGMAPASNSISLALDSAGNPMVAYGSGSAAFLKRWNGTAWIGMGGSDTGTGLSGPITGLNLVSLAIDSQDRPVVAWMAQSAGGDRDVYLRRWDGSTWVALGGSDVGDGISNNSTTAGSQGLYVDVGPGDNPGVAWADNPGGDDDVYYRQWDGSAWIELAGSATAGGVSNNTTMMTGSGNLALRFDPAGFPVIAWIDTDPIGVDRDAYLKRWDGSAWIELGGSATAGGLSNNATMTGTIGIDVGVDTAGNPVVAWYDSDGDTEVFAKAWLGESGPLEQRRTGDDSVITVGEATMESSVTIRGTMQPALGGPFGILQVEVQPIATPFTGAATTQSGPVTVGGPVSLTVFGLAPGSYHWRHRTLLSSGSAGDWTSFGGNSDGVADFIVTTPPTLYGASANPTLLTDGQTVTITVVSDTPGAVVTADFLGIDTTYVAGAEAVVPGAIAGEYIVTYTISPANARADGTFLVPVQLEKLPGVTVATSVSLTLDNTPPAAPTITAPTDGASTTATSILVSGTAPAGSTVTVSSDVDGVVGIGAVSASGTWTFTVTLTVGTHVLTAVAQEPSGLNSALSAGITVTVQATPPPASPTIKVDNRKRVCGMLGLELLLLLLLRPRVRRRRRPPPR